MVFINTKKNEGKWMNNNLGEAIAGIAIIIVAFAIMATFDQDEPQVDGQKTHE